MGKLDLEIIKGITIINFHGSLNKEDNKLIKELVKAIEKHKLFRIIYNFDNLIFISNDSLKLINELIKIIEFREGIQLGIGIPENINNLREVGSRKEALQKIKW